MTTDTALPELPNRFDYATAAERLYKMWEEHGCFHSEPDPAREPYTIVIPPPNVTGALHLGHALNNTLQDVQIRMKRMQGYNALWMPGTDHAGIATQAVVEKRLREEENLTRHDLGREKLVERIWEWKEQYEARILAQLKQMGCSCDWERLRFTLDENCARAVRQTFFDLFSKGLIYRGKRLVNWDTFLQTAVSDDEVFHETVKGSFWRFRYRVIDPKPGEPAHVTIATTRPETMLGDTAVAVHPDPARALDKLERELRDKLAKAPAKEKPEIEQQIENVGRRRSEMLPELEQLRDMARDGRQVMLPLLDRPIPLICDEWAKPELGSGCVKITPAHDPNDYEVGQRRPEIGAINILNPDGTLNNNAGPYAGQTIKEARKAVIADLAERGLHDPESDREDREIDLAHSDRSKTPIEPYLADQWFVKMDQLAQSAMDAVTDGRVRIVPERYAKSYLDWLSEKRDWPVGRQLWWGHRIPIWTVSFKQSAMGELNGSDAIRARGDELRSELQVALDELCEVAGLPKSFRVAPTERSSAKCFICVRGEEGQQHLTDVFDSIPRAQMVTPGEPIDIQTPAIAEDDPRFPAFVKIRDLINGGEQEDEVLDTWFSSALWPHSTLGWPGPPLDDNAPDWKQLKHYYPTSTLITSRDIITLWVARMVLMGLNNVGEVPFREVFIHPKILDGYGETMSKSKGNGVDPLDVIDKFGADALRFGLAQLTTETQDVRMPVQFECPHCETLIDQTKKNRELPRIECPKCSQAFSTQWAKAAQDTALPRGPVVSERFEVSRNFVNKLWNASRFALLNLAGYEAAAVADADLTVEDRWILSRLATVTRQVTEALSAYRYADACRTLYDFAWDEFCSFYIEMVKGRLQDDTARPTAQRVLAHTLDSLLRLLHPVIPFITEEVWRLLGRVAPERGLAEPAAADEFVMLAPWPAVDTARIDAEIEEQFADFQLVLGAVREIRSSQNIPPKAQIEFAVRCDERAAKLLGRLESYFESLAGARVLGFGPAAEAPKPNATASRGEFEIDVDLKDFIDWDKERERLEREQGKIAKLIESKEKKLDNANFVDRAPAEVVARERESLQQAREQLTAIEAAIGELPG